MFCARLILHAPFSQMDGNVFLILVSQAIIKAYYFSNVKAPKVF